MDISNLTYEELVAIEKDIVKRKKELKRAEYEDLIDNVITAMKAMIKAGFEDTICFWDSDDFSWSWGNLMERILEEYARKIREDY